MDRRIFAQLRPPRRRPLRRLALVYVPFVVSCCLIAAGIVRAFELPEPSEAFEADPSPASAPAPALPLGDSGAPDRETARGADGSRGTLATMHRPAPAH
jgi:hypothetical protein